MSSDSVITQLTWERLSPRELFGLHQHWLTATFPSGNEADLSCGAGLGSPGVFFSCGPTGERVYLKASMREVLDQLVTGLVLS